METFHDCLKSDLQNRYFKEKLTEFYKENKRLNERIQKLIDENETLRSERIDRASQVDHGTSPIKSEFEKKPDDQTVLQRNLLLSSGQKCSVCEKNSKNTKPNTKSSSSFLKSKLVQTDFVERNSVAVNTFDKDVFNRQNKVITLVLTLIYFSKYKYKYFLFIKEKLW